MSLNITITESAANYYYYYYYYYYDNVEKLCHELHLDTTSCAFAVAGIFVSLSSTSSKPIKSPTPLTSPIIGCFRASCRREFSRWFPTLVACSRSFCRSITSSTALTVAHDTGFPPYCKAHQSDRHLLQHKSSSSTSSSTSSSSSSSSSATLHCGLRVPIQSSSIPDNLWSLLRSFFIPRNTNILQAELPIFCQIYGCFPCKYQKIVVKHLKKEHTEANLTTLDQTHFLFGTPITVHKIILMHGRG